MKNYNLSLKKKIEKYFAFDLFEEIVSLERRMHSSYSPENVEEFIIQGLVSEHNDYALDFEWYKFKIQSLEKLQQVA